MLEDFGFPACGSEGKAVQEILWSTATPDSSQAHLFLAINEAMPRQVAEAGLDHFFTVRDALLRKSAKQPDLADYVERVTKPLPMQAFSVVRENKLDLIAFLGSQQVDANMFGFEFQGCGVMDYEEAFSLLADTRQAVSKLREQVAAGRGHFDAAVAERKLVGNAESSIRPRIVDHAVELMAAPS